MLLHSASDLDQRCLKTRNSKDGCTFPPNTFVPTPKIPPKTLFWGPFNAKPIIERAFLCKRLFIERSPKSRRALRKSHVNGATKLKLYSYIGIGKYLSASKLFR